MDIFSVLSEGVGAMFKSYKAHMPQILTGISVAGIFGTGFTASVATVKSCKKIEEIKKEKGVEKLTTKEVIKACWKYYIPAGVTAFVSSYAGIKSLDESMKSNAMLAALLQTAETRNADIMEAAEEVVGKKKKEEIESKAVSKETLRFPPTEDNIICTKYGTYLFREAITGQYFRSCETAVDDGIKKFNIRVREADEGDVCFADIFDFWGVQRRGPKQNSPIVDNTWCTHQVDYHIVWEKHVITGEPCGTVIFTNPPFDLDSITFSGDHSYYLYE